MDGIISLGKFVGFVVKSYWPAKIANYYKRNFKSKESIEYEQGLSSINDSFNDYIDTMLDCAANQINIQLQR